MGARRSVFKEIRETQSPHVALRSKRRKRPRSRPPGNAVLGVSPSASVVPLGGMAPQATQGGRQSVLSITRAESLIPITPKNAATSRLTCLKVTW